MWPLWCPVTPLALFLNLSRDFCPNLTRRLLHNELSCLSDINTWCWWVSDRRNVTLHKNWHVNVVACLQKKKKKKSDSDSRNACPLCAVEQIWTFACLEVERAWRAGLPCSDLKCIRAWLRVASNSGAWAWSYLSYAAPGLIKTYGSHKLNSSKAHEALKAHENIKAHKALEDHFTLEAIEADKALKTLVTHEVFEAHKSLKTQRRMINPT